MGMDFDLFQKRIRTSSYISLKKLQEDKMNSFKTALQKSYNRELVVNLRTKEEFMSLINKIDTNCAIFILKNIKLSVRNDSIKNLPIPYHIKYIDVSKNVVEIINEIWNEITKWSF